MQYKDSTADQGWHFNEGKNCEGCGLGDRAGTLQDAGIRVLLHQMKESSGGQLQLVEINSRLGGGTIFPTLAGANFPAMILDMLQGVEH